MRCGTCHDSLVFDFDFDFARCRHRHDDGPLEWKEGTVPKAPRLITGLLKIDDLDKWN